MEENEQIDLNKSMEKASAEYIGFDYEIENLPNGDGEEYEKPFSKQEDLDRLLARQKELNDLLTIPDNKDIEDSSETEEDALETKRTRKMLV